MTVLQIGGICLDCADAEELARFYCDVFGWVDVARDEDADPLGGRGWIQVTPADGGLPHLNIQAEAWYEPPVWPEQPGAQTKMMHFEVYADDVDEAVALVVAAGGREASPQPAGRDLTRLRVMLDPAGHPFCLCND